MLRSAADRYFDHTLPALELTSSAFLDGQLIPNRYAFTGGNYSPPLEWKAIPPATRSLTLLVEDVDAGARSPFVHWLVYNILPDISALPENISPLAQVRAYGLIHGLNSYKRLGYLGCISSPRKCTRHYHFQLFALDCILGIGPGKNRATILKAMRDHVLAIGRLIGIYV